MKFKITSRKIIGIGICLFIVAAVFIGLNQFFNNTEKNAAKIISIDLMKPEDELNFTVTVKIQNIGSDDINNAELNFIFIKDNDIVDSETQLLNLERNLQRIYNANFINVPFETDSTYKVITTIYLDTKLLDTKTITKQF